MAAIITSMPPALHLASAPVWWQVQSGIALAEIGKVTLLVTGGCGDGDTLRLRSGVGDFTFTAKTSPDPDNPFEFPATGPSLAQHADTIADCFRKNSQITRHFDVLRDSTSGEAIVLRKKIAEPFSVIINDDLIGIVATATSVTSPWQQENLSCVVEVWQPGDPPVQLAVFQATYRLQDRAVDIDISSAFAFLRPALPPSASISYVPPAVSGAYGEAPETWTAYYLLFADAYGQPAFPRTLQQSVQAIAIRGSLAGDSLWQADIPLRHAYRDRTLAPIRKPVFCDQPDWVYIFTGEIDPDTSFFISLLVRFDDGTEQVVAVTESGTLQPNRLYWFVSGFKQLGLEAITLPSGATRIVEYTWRLYPPDLANVPQFGAEVHYAVLARTDYDFFLVFENGVGGCETVALRGKATAKYVAQAEEYAKPRFAVWHIQEGDFGLYGMEGRKEFEVNTGLYDRTDPYLEHLLQLPLAACWFIDTFGQRFLPVRIEARDMVYTSDDDTLASISFTVRALWSDSNYNM